MKIKAEIKRNVSCRIISNKDIISFFTRIAKNFKAKKNMEVSLVIVDDDEMRKINKKWRKKDKTTDVLSFSLAPETGEILISCERVRAQARQFKVTNKEEIKRLILHGTLHLMGYTHKQMKKIENKILYV
ncbi:rRNA maturation RNase YbeY [Patescibacteria group bacterium]|nr:rRNA maturation RNase YbeY [Patescibacteria group bacterium]MBU1672961.1 rRNA maturation RNase YbeY [Patescibacteria group bacterium]